MATIGYALIQKSRGISCDVMLTYDQANWLGKWERLTNPVRPPGKYAKLKSLSG